MSKQIEFDFAIELDSAKPRPPKFPLYIKYDWEPPNVHGFTNRPYFAREISYEYPGFTQIVHNENFGGHTILVGDSGVQVHKCLASSLAGFAPCASDGGPSSPCAGKIWPLDGWRVVSVSCDQTGGMCMVDVYTFENGWVLTVNDECAIMWNEYDKYANADGDDASCAIVLF